MLPKIYYGVKHPRTPILVVYTDPTQRDRRGKPKRVQKWFTNEKREEAEKYHTDLMKTAASVGTSGLSMDARARADYYAGREVLDAAGFTGMSVTEVLRDAVKTKPAAARLNLPVAELIPLFATAKEVEENASAPTVDNLKKRVTAWVRRENIVTLADITEETLLALKQRKTADTRGCTADQYLALAKQYVKDGNEEDARIARQRAEALRKRGVSARTKINDMAAVSSFLSWLKERKFFGTNPLLEISRPKTDGRIPKVLKPAQVKALLESALELGEGRLLKYVVLLTLAGLRPSEAAQVTEDQVRLNAKPPFIRVLRGKKRNHPRPAPVLKNFKAWWNAASWPVDDDGKRLPLFRFDSRPDLDLFAEIRERAGLIKRIRNPKTRKMVNVESHWQEDIPRHTWISVRMQQTKDEAQVAYEAGTSIDMIHGHYLDTLDDKEVKAIVSIQPPKRAKADLTATSTAAQIAA